MQTLTRRQAFGRIGSRLPRAVSQVEGAPVLVPRDGLVNVLEYEAQARLALPPSVYASIAGGDREPFDRITLRPRMLVSVVDLDLSLSLFGDSLFAPIVVGPVADQARFHADGELAMVAGASAANAAVVLSSRSSVPLRDVLAQAATPVWYQAFAGDNRAPQLAGDAVQAGCKVVCVTVGVAPASAGAWAAVPPDWPAVAALARGVGAPVVVKGVMTPADAKLALESGAQGLIVSNHGGMAGSREGSLVLSLAAIVDAVNGRVPVLADGSFRRGTDILKALAFGAKAVFVARPVMWGLGAYGADGVQGVIEMLQTELARYMAMCGKPALGSLDRTIVRVHAAR